MKLCAKHHDLLTGNDECFQCEIERLRQMIGEYQVENKQLKKTLAENNAPIP